MLCARLLAARTEDKATLESDPSVGAGSTSAHGASSTTTDVLDNTFTPIPGAYARLTRNNNNITVNIHTLNLPPGAYSVWWVIWNHPENCLTDCLSDPDDVDNSLGTGETFVNATGHVLGRGAAANFSASLSVGGPYSGEYFFGPGLTNPGGVLVLLVVRYHGPAIPGMIPQQTAYFEGGCPGGLAPCEDMQFVVFEP